MSRLATIALALTLTACEVARARSGSPTEGEGWVEKDCAYDAGRRTFTASVGDSFPPPIVQAWYTSETVYSSPADVLNVDPDGLMVLEDPPSADVECTVYVWR